jgi:hypothetical protein
MAESFKLVCVIRVICPPEGESNCSSLTNKNQIISYSCKENEGGVHFFLDKQ